MQLRAYHTGDPVPLYNVALLLVLTGSALFGQGLVIDRRAESVTHALAGLPERIPYVATTTTGTFTGSMTRAEYICGSLAELSGQDLKTYPAYQIPADPAPTGSVKTAPPVPVTLLTTTPAYAKVMQAFPEAGRDWLSHRTHCGANWLSQDPITLTQAR